MTVEVIPAVLATGETDFRRKLGLMEGIARTIQVDIMDGAFVPNKTWYDGALVASWKCDFRYELHLMVNDPMPIIEHWLPVRGIKRAIIHADAPLNIPRALKWIRAHHLETGVALSPGVSPDIIDPWMKAIDMVLVMGGKPGFSGKKLDRKTLETVRILRKRYPKLQIGFDIGVGKRTIPDLVLAGVTRLCTASAIFKTEAPGRAYLELVTLANASS